MHRGYIKVWRKISDSGLLQLPNTLAVFMYILLNATHKPIKTGTSTGIVQLQIGQFISGRLALAKHLDQSEQEIRTSIDRLVKLEILTITATNRYSIYTIVNYSNYQDDNQQATSGATNKQPTDNQQITTKQELKHLSIKEKTIMSGKPDVMKLNGHRKEALEALQFLNIKAKRNYRGTEVNIKLIVSRFNEGYSLQDCKSVIAKKCREWLPDDKMREYLRPATLFNREKFNQYIGEIVEVQDE